MSTHYLFSLWKPIYKGNVLSLLMPTSWTCGNGGNNSSNNNNSNNNSSSRRREGTVKRRMHIFPPLPLPLPLPLPRLRPVWMV